MQKLAATASCVTIIIVASFVSLIFWRFWSKAVADLESNAPVGSSANTNDGFVISARAADVRCFVPRIFHWDIYLKFLICLVRMLAPLHDFQQLSWVDY